MIHAPQAISAFLLALAAASWLYTAFATLRLLTFQARCIAVGDAGPTITVLKPLAGAEPELEESLRSFCTQEYARYAVVFCAKDPADPALAVAERIRDAMPQVEIAVVSGGGARALNPKIENLAAAMPLASGEVLVIADSDMRVEPQYLQRVAAAFADPTVGAVTTLYSARSTGGLAARLGALFVNDQFAPSVLVATALQPLRYCFGATMAVRASVLEEIGGIEALGGTIADDYALGDLVARRGRRVALAATIPSTLISERTIGALLAREIRWARTIRAVRPLGYPGTVLAFPMLLSLVAAFFVPDARAAGALFAAAVALRLGLHAAARRALRVDGRAQFWLVPLREVLGAIVWAAGFFGSSARWRQARVDVRARRD